MSSRGIGQPTLRSTIAGNLKSGAMGGLKTHGKSTGGHKPAPGCRDFGYLAKEAFRGKSQKKKKRTETEADAGRARKAPLASNSHPRAAKTAKKNTRTQRQNETKVDGGRRSKKRRGTSSKMTREISCFGKEKKSERDFLSNKAKNFKETERFRKRS